MTPTDATTNIPAADQPAPVEFDLLCEHCGYSLVGLIGSNRCPECGETFEPNQLPLARVPWLYRARLGSWTSYLQTVWLILFRPATFATELCRPVRVSNTDARAFRRRSIWIAVVTCFVVVLALGSLVMYSQIKFYLAMSPTASVWLWAIYGVRLLVFSVIAAAAILMLLTMATDQPTFIWQGIADAPGELAPAQHYAAAPLALTPLLALIVFAIAAHALTHSVARFEQAITVSTSVAASILAFSLIVTAIIFMRVASGCSAVRMFFLALYLPFHYALMVTAAIIAGGLMGGLANTILMELGFRMF